jgi:hypothetical protein
MFRGLSTGRTGPKSLSLKPLLDGQQGNAALHPVDGDDDGLVTVMRRFQGLFPPTVLMFCDNRGRARVSPNDTQPEVFVNCMCSLCSSPCLHGQPDSCQNILSNRWGQW